VGKLSDSDSKQDGAAGPIPPRYTSQSLAVLLEVLRRLHADDPAASSDAGKSDRVPPSADRPTKSREP